MAQAEKPQQNIEGNSNSPVDLLQRLISSRKRSSQRVCQETETDGESEDIELTLGLSLNGRFGVDPKAKKLSRSSSIPDFIIDNPTKESAGFSIPAVRSSGSNSSLNLVRTCSLPTETDEEWRKRKEIQMLRRMEAKRKRSEKQRNSKASRDRKDHNFEEDKRENGIVSNGSSYHQEQFLKNFNGSLPPPSQGSTGSQGSGSSGLSESDNQPVQGISKCSEARSPVSVQSLSECEQKLTVMPPTNGKSVYRLGLAMENNRSNIPNGGAKEMARNVLEDMPCVSTKGDGPNGKRIEGFLYRYRKGEEVRIVCVCHGSFLSPAEFVRHAGGGDVTHPLKHIVVNPHPLL